MHPLNTQSKAENLNPCDAAGSLGHRTGELLASWASLAQTRTAKCKLPVCGQDDTFSCLPTGTEIPSLQAFSTSYRFLGLYLRFYIIPTSLKPLVFIGLSNSNLHVKTVLLWYYYPEQPELLLEKQRCLLTLHGPIQTCPCPRFTGKLCPGEHAWCREEQSVKSWEVGLETGKNSETHLEETQEAELYLLMVSRGARAALRPTLSQPEDSKRLCEDGWEVHGHQGLHCQRDSFYISRQCGIFKRKVKINKQFIPCSRASDALCKTNGILFIP